MESMQETLRSLRDVDGVHGSFVVETSGALVASDLPSIFDGALFSEVGPRLARLHEAFLSGGEELDACVMRFAEHKLYVRKMKSGLIGTISATEVNLPALRMVVNLVIRRLDPLLGRAAFSLTPPPPSTSPRPASSIRSVAPGPPASQRDRGSDSGASRLSDPGRLDGLAGKAPEPTVIPEDGRGPAVPTSNRHVRMYRGRRVEE